MKKRLTSQPEALSDEGFHGTAAPVGSVTRPSMRDGVVGGDRKHMAI